MITCVVAGHDMTRSRLVATMMLGLILLSAILGTEGLAASSDIHGFKVVSQTADKPGPVAAIAARSGRRGGLQSLSAHHPTRLAVGDECGQLRGPARLLWLL